MSTQVGVVYSEIQRTFIENTGDGGATWPSGMWTITEVISYLAQREDRFLAATALLWKRAETAITTGQANQPAPTDWIATVLIAHKSSAGVYRELPRMDRFELDAILSTWPGASSATPKGYYEPDGENTLTTYVAPIPTDVGSALERYYVYLSTHGEFLFTVPDEFVPCIKYGVMADMLSKVGPAANPTLAAVCEALYESGIAMGQLIAQEGWFAL